MPFNKSYGRGRRRRRRVMGPSRLRYRGRRRTMTSGRVKRIIDAEIKTRDLSVEDNDLVAGSGGGSVVVITSIGQGDSNTERTGNWIKPVSFMATLVIQSDQASAPTTSRFRVGCFVWMEDDNQNTPEIQDILQDPFEPHQQFNVQNKGQFKILWNRTGVVVNNADNTQFVKTYRFYVKPTQKILYDGQVLKKYHLFIFAQSDATANTPTLTFSARVRYTDS